MNAQRDLGFHIKKHDKLVSLKCDICDKKNFKFLSHVERHKESCSKKFSQKVSHDHNYAKIWVLQGAEPYMSPYLFGGYPEKSPNVTKLLAYLGASLDT